jgi:adenylate cyclase
MNETRDKSIIDKRITLVAIDDYTIKKIGKWPFPRENYSKLLKKLNTFGAKTVAFDVFFSEDSLRCPGVNVDEEFGEAVASFQEVPGNSVIIPYSLTTYPEEVFEEFPEDLYIYSLSARVPKDLGLVDKFVEKKVFPIPALTNAGASLAHLQVEPDLDGIMRHYQVVGNVDTQYLPGFSLSVYQAYTGDQPKVEILNYDNYKIKLKTGDLPINQGGETKVRWIGGERNFPVIRFWDVLEASDDDKKMRELLNGNIVFIGSTAFAAHDLRHTPVDPIMPGVIFHMNMAHMLLEGKFFKPAIESERISWALLIAGTLLILIIQFFGNAIFDVAGLVAIIGGLIFYDLSVLTPEGHEIKLFFILVSIIGCYSWNTFLHFYLANKDKSFLKSAFGNYISPELIDEMYKSGEPPKLGGDSGVRTAFFTDIQGFSTFSEKLSATQLVELLNEYLTHMTDILLEEGGTLDKYEGDAIIAFFGAPMELEDHAERACRVAHRMQERLAELRLKWQSEGEKWPEIVHAMRMRVGINSGEIVTGNMGSASRMNYTMMGDAVNLAARLEESAKQYGIFTQAAEASVLLAGDRFLFRELDTVRVVGKSVAIKSFDLLGLKDSAPEFLIELASKFTEAIGLYKAQKFKEALAIFESTKELEYQRFPELKDVKTNPSEVYIERCETYMQTPPPPDWDGVWTLTSK